MVYVLRRILSTAPVMAVVALLVFLLIHLSAGDPAALIAGDTASAEDIAQLRVALGLDEPIWQQFLGWVARIAHGDLGVSMFTKVPVTELLRSRLEPTSSIALLTMGLALPVAIPLGVAAAHFAGRWPDRAAMLLATLDKMAS